MGKYVKSRTRGVLKLLGRQDPLFAAGVAAGSWRQDLRQAVNEHLDEMQANLINKIVEYVNNPRKQEAAAAALEDWYVHLEGVAARMRALWANIRGEVENAFAEIAQQWGLIERLRQQFVV